MPDTLHVNTAAEQITHHLLGQNADSVVLIALTDRKGETGALIGRVTELLGEIPVLEAVRADGTHYWSHTGETTVWGTPYADPSVAQIIVEAIGLGLPIYASRAELEARYNTVPARLLVQVRDTLNIVANELGSPETIDHANVSARVLQEFDTVITRGDALSAESIAWLAIGASMTQIRDDMWARMTRTNAQTHAEIWTLVANQVVDEASVAPYTLCAFANWLHGDGAQALIVLDRVLTIEPSYSMSGLVKAMIEHAVGPEFWDGFDPTGAI